jgi:hypothetical protein
MKEVKMYGFSKMGYGPKKTECQDSYCIMDRFVEDCHFFAGIFSLYNYIIKFMMDMDLLVRKHLKQQMIIFKRTLKKTLKK